MVEQVTPTPVPYKKLLPLAIIYFIEAFVFTNIFSYVGFMVFDFKLTDDPDKVGYYAGYIGSTFSIAGFLSSFWWGKVSDRYGRRPVLIFGCFGGLVSTLLFGFSTNLYMAIGTRFAAGILNGNVGVVKGYAADICDKTNQVKGVGVMQLGWGLGGIIGPLIGGILSRPCTEAFSGMCSSDSLFLKFPYLLPNLFSCLVSLIAIITLFIYLPKEEKGKKDIAMKRIGSNEFSINEEDSNEISTMSDTSDYESGVEGTAATLQTRTLTREDSVTSDTADLLGGGHSNKKGLRNRFSQWIDKKMDKDSIFSNKIAMLTVLSYSILGASFTMFDEAFPLLAMSPSSDGGLSASTTDIGAVGAINGVAAVVIQLIIFYPIATKLKFVRLYRFGLILGIVVFVNYPTLNLAANKRVWLWVFLSIITVMKVACGQFAFSAITAIVSNTCPLKQVGSINGFAQSSVALFRAFSPAIAGNLLAWGFDNGFGFPLNQFFVFIMISLGLCFSLAISIMLPRTLDYPYEDLPANGIIQEGEKEGEKEEKESMLHNNASIEVMVGGKDLDVTSDFSLE